MTQARNHHLCFDESVFYHLVSRCVRRAYLCGTDRLSKQRYDHRKRWLEKRLFGLSELFFIDLYGYAIMSNHYHLVVQTRPDRMRAVDDREIAVRWCRLFPRAHEDESERVAVLLRQPQKLQVYRERLVDISWLMRCLNEPIARRSNEEDGCTGRFWEGRFTSQILADESAVLMCLAYVDLNPVRAGIAETAAQSRHTSLCWRLGHTELSGTLSAINQGVGAEAKGCTPLSMTFAEYRLLVEESGRRIGDGASGMLDAKALALIGRLGLSEQGYVLAMKKLRRLFYRVIGRAHHLEEMAAKLNQQWLAGRSGCRAVYR